MYVYNLAIERYEDWEAMSPRAVTIYNAVFSIAMVVSYFVMALCGVYVVVFYLFFQQGAFAVVLFIILTRLLQWWRSKAAPVDEEMDSENEEQVEMIVNSRFI